MARAVGSKNKPKIESKSQIKNENTIQTTPTIESSQSTSTQASEQHLQFDFMEFAKTMSSTNTPYLDNILGAGYLNNPFWMNSLLKTGDGHPEKYSRDKIVEALKDPTNNEKMLRQCHVYFYHTSLFYKRIIEYMSTMLLFKGYIQPEGVTKADIQSKAWQKSYQKAIQWLRDFNIEYECRRIVETVIGEDAGFFYLRKSEEGYNLQKMPDPSTYCKIVRKVGNVYQYAFNMVYFLKPGSLIVEDFDPFFKEQLEIMIEGKSDKEQSMMQYFWVELDPSVAPCIKYNEISSSVIPVFVGAFLDIMAISEYKDLIKTKSVLDAFELLVQKIPLKSDKDITKADPFLLDGKTSGQFHQSVKSTVPAGVNVATTPMDITPIKFDKSDNKDSIIGFAETSFYKNIGISNMLFNSDNATSMSLIKSMMTDETFVMKLMKPIEAFINLQLKKVTGKYIIKLKFSPLTYYNTDDKLTSWLNGGQHGLPVSQVINAMGYHVWDVPELNAFEDVILDVHNWQPLASSFTQSGNDKGGRPENNNISDSKDKTIDLGSNLDRGTGNK